MRSSMPARMYGSMPVASLIIKELDLSNKDDVARYEKALYRAFRSYRPENFENIWVFDHAAGHAKTLLPYEGQRIVVADVGGEFVGAVALNLDMENWLQVERYGFTVPKLAGKTAEGLALFSNRLLVGRELVLVRLVEAADVLLRSLSISTLWGSCDRRHLLGYLQVGFRNVGKVHFNGRDEFLLQRNFSA